MFTKINALLTGSRLYGSPREDSDVDLVVLTDWDTIKLLIQISGQQRDEVAGSAPNACQYTFRFGPLNLIAVCSEEYWDAWIEATLRAEELSILRGTPVGKMEAKEIFRGIFAERGLEPLDADTKDVKTDPDADTELENESVISRTAEQ